MEFCHYFVIRRRSFRLLPLWLSESLLAHLAVSTVGVGVSLTPLRSSYPEKNLLQCGVHGCYQVVFFVQHLRLNRNLATQLLDS